MTSKEIVKAHIEHFEKCRKAYTKASDIESANEYAKDIETFKIILQALERLEQVEKENQELKELIDSLNKEQILDVERIFDLEIENEKYQKAIKNVIEKIKIYKIRLRSKEYEEEHLKGKYSTSGLANRNGQEMALETILKLLKEVLK